MSARILVIEDEPAVRMIVVDLLRDSGYVVEECEDGTTAAERLQDVFDLLIVDVMMPGQLDGFGVCHQARERASTEQS